MLTSKFSLFVVCEYCESDFIKKPQQIILQNSGQLHLPVYSAMRGWKKFVTVPK